MTDFEEPPARAKKSRDLMIVRVKPESRERFIKKASARGMNISQAMREALRDWMAKP